MPLVEIERKYLVSPERFPSHLWEALRTGSPHPNITRHGRITQLYLPITTDTVRQAVHTILLTQKPEEKLSGGERTFFSDPTNISELRILQREQSFLDTSNLLGDSSTVAIPDGFQITLKGHAQEQGALRPNIETPISTHRNLAWDIADLIEYAEGHHDWSEEVMKVEKMWYDITYDDPHSPTGRRIAELDIFPDLHYMAVAEVEATSMDDLAHMHPNRPPWLGTDVTEYDELKVRNLVRRPNAVLFPPKIRELLKPYMGAWVELYQPTILGESIQNIAEEIRAKTFVVIGSFRKWLPHIRRIVQDLDTVGPAACTPTSPHSTSPAGKRSPTIRMRCSR